MKYRAEQRERRVPHVVDGRTRMVTEPYTVHVPELPRDWDQIVLRGATVTATLVVAASVVWSTASIAGLLSATVATPVAFIAAAVFDAVWITNMALEWLARYDRARAVAPRQAGHASLVTAMAAVVAHGWMTGNIVAGIVGASISGLAKMLWTVLIAHSARPLDDRTRQWVEQEMAEASALLGLAAVRRQLARATALTALVNTAANTPNSPDDDPNNPVRHTANTPVESSVENTVRAEQPNSDEQTNSRSEAVVRLVPNTGETIADTVHRLVRDGVRDRVELLDAVREIHGEKVSKDTVRITRDRALKRLSA
ncbi:protein transporter Sec31 [Embleya sp. NPDC005971]|uniref:protein transporter Sec31 n=1 Tax=Embleya sp. NPDC005971 TaxID=3156724 RepID=UPI0033F99556